MTKAVDQQMQSHNLADLLYLMKRLRDPENGCPWDIEQTFQSITPSTIEEAYEVVEAIESGDRQKIKEELGDLLFQVIFYSQLATEEESFQFSDVVNALTKKLIRRHPHVFPDGSLLSSREKNEQIKTSQVAESWESIKQKERQGRGETGLLSGIAHNLPALTIAGKLQKRAAKVGFDWRHSRDIVAKIKEETRELEESLSEYLDGESADLSAVEDELGDLMFSCVNLSRFLHLDAEKVARGANRKFVARVRFMENALESAGLSMEDASSEEMEIYWQKAKQAGL